MAGKHPSIKAFSAHKQLLVAESELNRTLLMRESQRAVAGIEGAVEEAKSFGTLAAILAAGFLAFRKSPAPPAPSKHPWLSRMVSGARKGAVLWAAFRDRPSKSENDNHQDGQ